MKVKIDASVIFPFVIHLLHEYVYYPFSEIKVWYAPDEPLKPVVLLFPSFFGTFLYCVHGHFILINGIIYMKFIVQ